MRWLDGHEFKQALGDSEKEEVWHAVVGEVARVQTDSSN